MRFHNRPGMQLLGVKGFIHQSVDNLFLQNLPLLTGQESLWSVTT